MAKGVYYDLYRRKDLGHLSVIPTLDGKQWQASFRRKGTDHYIVGTHQDISTAIELALRHPMSEYLSDDQIDHDIDDWMKTLDEAERRRKQPYPHQTVEELVDKLPAKFKRTRGKHDDII